MCCFGTRVFLLILITFLSFVLNRFYPQIPVIIYYLIMANLLAFCIFLLFFKGRLPKFVKEGAVHYFSIIGGILGALISTAIFKGLKFDKFLKIEILIFALWVLAFVFITLNFAEITKFLVEFLK